MTAEARELGQGSAPGVLLGCRRGQDYSGLHIKYGKYPRAIRANTYEDVCSLSEEVCDILSHASVERNLVE